MARDEAALERATSDLRQTTGATVSTFAADLSLEDAPGQLFRWAAENGLEITNRTSLQRQFAEPRL